MINHLEERAEQKALMWKAGEYILPENSVEDLLAINRIQELMNKDNPTKAELDEFNLLTHLSTEYEYKTRYGYIEDSKNDLE